MKSAAIAPAVEILVDGSILDDATLAFLASVRVARRLSLPAQCEIAFALDGPNAGDLPAKLPIGAAVDVTVADDSGALFSGDVTAQGMGHEADGAAELAIRATTRCTACASARRSWPAPTSPSPTWPAELGGDAGLGVEADEDGPRWPVLVQHCQSDLDLLRGGRAGRAVVRGDRRDAAGVQPGRHRRPRDLALHDTLLAARFDATADSACTSVTTDGWDPVAAVRLQGAAGGPRNERDTGAAVGPSAVDADGEVALWTTTARPRPPRRRGPGRARPAGGPGGHPDRHRRGRRRPPARPPGACRRGRFEVSGTYVLTAIDHTIDALPATSSSCRPRPGAPRPPTRPSPAWPGWCADDPDGLGRVKVALAGYGDVETDWRGRGPGVRRAAG